MQKYREEKNKDIDIEIAKVRSEILKLEQTKEKAKSYYNVTNNLRKTLEMLASLKKL